MKNLLRLSLLSILSLFFCGTTVAQKVTLDFTTNEWGFPEGSANKSVDEATFSNGTYTIKLAGSTGNGYYFNTDGYLLLGKTGATLTLPAFDFNVVKIEVVGSSKASANVQQNLYVGETAVSTQTTGATSTNTYAIAADYQAAGNVYVLKVESKHNTQITAIKIYDTDEGGTVDPGTGIANTPDKAYTVAEAIKLIDAGDDLDTKVYVKGYIVGTPDVSTSYGNATYNISDTKGDETTTIKVFRGYYLNSEKFTAEDQIATGDEVVVYGQLTLYNNTTYEVNSGNYLYSINGNTGSSTGDDISNTVGGAYTIAKAHELITAGTDLDTEVYVKGIVTSVKSFNSSYGSITYYLGDTQDDANPLQIYGGLYYNGDMFNSMDDLQAGDEIVVYGKLKDYNGTHEMDKNNVVITHKRDGKDVTPSESKDISNTPENAYPVADAIALIDAGEGLTSKVYVKGYITSISSVDTGSYGNATYNISDTKDDETTVLKIYRGYYLDGEKFTSEDQIAVGDEVIVYGNLTLYGTTYELNTGNYLYSINGKTTGISTIEDSKADNAPVYNIAGQRVDGSAKGLLIQNGRKFIRK